MQCNLFASGFLIFHDYHAILIMPNLIMHDVIMSLSFEYIIDNLVSAKITFDDFLKIVYSRNYFNKNHWPYHCLNINFAVA